MKLTVINLLKQVPLPSEMRMGDDGLMDRTKAKSIINIDCQFALEAGLQIKKQYPDVRLVVCSMGPASFETSLRKALALGYDEAYLLTDNKLRGSDTYATGLALSHLLHYLGFSKESEEKFIVLAGRQSSDGDTAHVPSQVAAHLGVAQATFVEKIQLQDGEYLIAKRIIEGGFQEMKLPLPCVVSITPTGVSLRKPSLYTTIKAKEKKITRLGIADNNLGVENIGISGSPTIVVKVVDMLSEHAAVRIMQGADEKEKVKKLLLALSEKNDDNQQKEEKQQEEQKEIPDFPMQDIRDDYRGILTWAEVVNQKISRSSIEILSAARQLQTQLDNETKITTLLIGDKVKHLAEDLIAYGADEVVVVEDNRLQEYQILPFTSAFVQYIQKIRPEIVLFAATTAGRELAPRIAVYTGSGVTADCTDLEIGYYINRKKQIINYPLLHSHRPTYGESKLATILGFKFPQISTARPGTFSIPLHDTSRQGKITTFHPSWKDDDFCVSLLQTFRNESGLQNLFDADVIVSGGRGATVDNLQLIKDLIEVFRQKGVKADWGASRVAVDAGFAPYTRQVGQTGITVRPKCYIAVGISGAIQHIAGLKEAEKIIAIDENPKASIFKYADYGIVGKYQDVLPEFIEQLSQCENIDAILSGC